MATATATTSTPPPAEDTPRTAASDAANAAKPVPDDAAATDSASTFYGYMYEEDKGPTRQFDDLLRAIGQHIVCPDRSSAACISHIGRAMRFAVPHPE